VTAVDDAPGARRLSRWVVAVLVLATVAVQSWILRLPFQLDDYVVLAHPLDAFHGGELAAGAGRAPFMLRWTMWGLFALVEAFLEPPWSPVPFHVVGLALHVAATLLVARIAWRAERALGLRHAALAAGLVFGLAGGHAQAFSWTGAWSAALYTLFALLSLDRFLAARETRGRAALLQLVLAVVALWLSLVSKEPALVLVPVVLVVLLATAPRTAASGGPGALVPLDRLLPRAARREAAGVLLAVLGLFACRYAFLGTIRVGYYEREAPGPLELATTLPRGLLGLAQALYPWNRDPLFAGEGVAYERWLGLSAAGAAALGVLPWLGLALALRPRARPALLLGCAAVLGTALLPGFLHDGVPTNVNSRTAYAPLAAAAVTLGLAVGALGRRPGGGRSPLGLVAGAFLVLLALAGTAHVASTERAMAGEQAALRAEVDRLAREHAESASPRPLLVLLLAPDSGYGGIPCLGDLAPRAFAPPFAPPGGPRVLAFADPDALADAWDELDLAAHDVVLIGPEVERADESLLPAPPQPEEEGRRARERRRPRALTPLRGGHGPGERLAERALRRDGVRWEVEPPLAAHLATAFALRFPARPVAGELVLHEVGGGERGLPLSFAGGDAASPIALGVPPRPELLARPAVVALEWRGTPEPAELRLLDALPSVAPLEPAPGATLAGVERPPRFRARLPAGFDLPARLRLELRFAYRGPPLVAAYETARVPGAQDVELVPRELRFGAAGRGPWSDTAAVFIGPLLASGALLRADFSWRVQVLHENGVQAARGPWSPAAFAPPAGPP